MTDNQENAFEVDYSDAWAEEIQKRIADIESGAVKPLPWEEA